MSKEELQDARYKGCFLKLSANDRRRLKMLADHEMYRDVVQYMLKNDVKLEQEIVSFRNMEHLHHGN